MQSSYGEFLFYKYMTENTDTEIITSTWFPRNLSNKIIGARM